MISRHWLLMWIEAFALTQAVEIPIYAAPLWRRERDGPQQRHGTVRLARALVLAFVASAATHPAVWFVFPVLVPRSYWTMVAAAEAFAICFEAAYLWALGVRRPLLWSLAANAASASVGFLRYALLGA